MAPKLIANVEVDGVWYGPAHGNAENVPAGVAEQITNSAAWEDGDEPVTSRPAASFGQTAAAPTPPAGAPAGMADFNPNAPIAELVDYVGDDATRAQAVLDAERAKGDDARKTLVERLEAITGTGG